MGMRTRRGYLGFLVGSALAAVLGSTVVFTAGCGGGTPENTVFFGSYTGVWRVVIPTTVIPENCTGTTFYDGQVSFSVDEKGRIRGSIFNPYGNALSSVNPTNSAGNLTGTIDNSGKFYAKVDYGNGKTADIQGSLSTQSNSIDGDAIFQAVLPAACGLPTTTLTTGTAKTGLCGNFQEKIDGTEYNGNFFSQGGTATAG